MKKITFVFALAAVLMVASNVAMAAPGGSHSFFGSYHNFQTVDAASTYANSVGRADLVVERINYWMRRRGYELRLDSIVEFRRLAEQGVFEVRACRSVFGEDAFLTGTYFADGRFDDLWSRDCYNQENHGGKFLTTEYIVLYHGEPLLSLTCGNIIWVPREPKVVVRQPEPKVVVVHEEERNCRVSRSRRVIGREQSSLLIGLDHGSIWAEDSESEVQYMTSQRMRCF